MIRDWLTDQALIAGPIFAMSLFITLFVGVVIWIHRPGSRGNYETLASLPLSHDSQERPIPQSIDSDDSEREENHGRRA